LSNFEAKWARMMCERDGWSSDKHTCTWTDCLLSLVKQLTHASQEDVSQNHDEKKKVWNHVID
jgi:hypothetical protein